MYGEVEGQQRELNNKIYLTNGAKVCGKIENKYK
jgi:sRNA-binding regulator protein Hfq